MKMIRMSMAALIAVATPLMSAQAAEPLVTGLAIYDIGVDPSGSAPLGAITGAMTAKLTRECDAYLTEAVLEADIVGPDGTAIPMTVTSRHRETADSLEFDVVTSLAGVEVDAARGNATRDAEGIEVALTAPVKETLRLPGGPLFPVALLEATIAAAKAGERMREFEGFDGTGGGREVWTISALITPAGNVAAADEDLFVEGLGYGELDHWKMTLAYFPPGGGGGEQTPSFSTDMVVYENGFAQAAVYDLGQFAMKLNLTEFQPIPPAPCP